jgi:hypothetical protein
MMLDGEAAEGDGERSVPMMRRLGCLAVLVTLALPAAAQASVRLVQRPAGSPGDDATLTVRVSPTATCSIEVIYKSGRSHARGLGPKHGSQLSWTWMIGTRTTPGSWPVIVSCGRAGSLRTAIRVA